MAKKQNIFICQACGGVQQKWSGKCTACGTWDSIIEELVQGSGYSKINKDATANANGVLQFVGLDGDIKDFDRIKVTISELDRVLGGGLVAGSAILMGGDPGIGKSTIILQTAAILAKNGQNVAYVSGEESIQQVRLRARRLNVADANVKLASITKVNDILQSVHDLKPNILIIDSIQTMFVDEIGAAPGTVSQVRAAAHELITYCKTNNITLFLIGHVTKDGQIAGPKVLEHMVDTVLYFEGERGHQFRILRAVKNRFGAANEIGVFEMAESGLREVTNPSALFLSDRKQNVAGNAVFAGIEGTRPVLIEVQALVTATTTPTPRRAVVGWDLNRLSMIMAILQARYGIFLGDKEVYLNITGGLKITEPALDLAAAAALISATTGIMLPDKTVIFGELGLSGEVRMVAQTDLRIKEASRLGFLEAFVPGASYGTNYKQNKGFILREINHIREFKDFFGAKK